MDDFSQGLNQTDEYRSVLEPGLWRFVAASLTFPLGVAWICHRWWGTVRVPLCDSFPCPTSPGNSKSQPTFWSHLYLGGTLVDCAMARGMQLRTKVPPPHRDIQMDRHSGTGSATKLLSVLQYSCKHEKCHEISRALDQGVWCECLLWSTAAWSASESTFECPSWSGLTWTLTSLPADRMDVLSSPDWMCCSYRLCSIRVQISFALFSFRKKAICFVYPCKSQKF